MAGPHSRLYRYRQGAWVAGVCAGMSDFYGVNVTWIRLGFLAFVAATGGIGALAYIIFMTMMPMREPSEEELAKLKGRSQIEDKKFWQSVRKNPRSVARTIRARLREIDRRLADAETYLTSPDKRLAREIDSLR